MQSNTHNEINEELCGTAVKIEQDYSLVKLETNEAMIADLFGLIHGGFIFGAADYAAMLAVNDPNVVLGAADVQFLKPLKKGETVFAEARVVEVKNKKRIVDVSVKDEKEEIFKGSFTCFVLEKHLLDET